MKSEGKTTSNDAFWSPTVNELIENFRSAIVSIVPHFDKAQIGWGPPDAYDQWDNVAKALFDGLVVENVRFGVGLTDVEAETLSIARYDFGYPDYRGLSYFEVLSPNDGTRRLAFSGFSSHQSYKPFDLVQCVPIETSGERLGHAVAVPMAGATFAFVLQGAGVAVRFDRLSIRL